MALDRSRQQFGLIVSQGVHEHRPRRDGLRPARRRTRRTVGRLVVWQAGKERASRRGGVQRPEIISWSTRLLRASIDRANQPAAGDKQQRPEEAGEQSACESRQNINA